MLVSVLSPPDIWWMPFPLLRLPEWGFRSSRVRVKVILTTHSTMTPGSEKVSHFTLSCGIFIEATEMCYFVHSVPFGDISLRMNFAARLLSLGLRYKTRRAVSRWSVNQNALLPDPDLCCHARLLCFSVPDQMGSSTSTHASQWTWNISSWNLYYRKWTCHVNKGPLLWGSPLPFLFSLWTWHLCPSKSGMPYVIDSHMHISPTHNSSEMERHLAINNFFNHLLFSDLYTK